MPRRHSSAGHNKKTYLKSDNIYECEVDAYSVLRITNTYFGIIAVFLLPKI